MLLIELRFVLQRRAVETRIGYKPTLFRWLERGMGAKLSSITQLYDVVIIDEHTIVRQQVALRILFELKIVQKGDRT